MKEDFFITGTAEQQYFLYLSVYIFSCYHATRYKSMNCFKENVIL